MKPPAEELSKNGVQSCRKNEEQRLLMMVWKSGRRRLSARRMAECNWRDAAWRLLEPGI